VCPSGEYLEDGCCDLREELVNEPCDGHSKKDESNHNDQRGEDKDGEKIALRAESEGVNLGVINPLEVKKTNVVLEVIVVLDAFDLTAVQVEDCDPDSTVAVQQTNRVLARPEYLTADRGVAVQKSCVGDSPVQSRWDDGALLRSALGDVLIDGGIGGGVEKGVAGDGVDNSHKDDNLGNDNSSGAEAQSEGRKESVDLRRQVNVGNGSKDDHLNKGSNNNQDGISVDG